MRLAVVAAAVLAAVPTWADSHFRVAIVPRGDPLSTQEQCDIRLKVDHEVEVTLQKDQIRIRTISGQDARNDGSECTAPLPDHDPRSFAFHSIDGRGEVRLLEPPTRENDFRALVRIRDTSTGMSRYHFRLTWLDAETGPETHRGERDALAPPRGPAGFAWNNVTSYRGHGDGESQLGSASQHLADVSVDIDGSGNMLVTFTTGQIRGQKPKQVIFTGALMERNENLLKGDMVTQDGRLRGTMTLTIDRQNVNRIALDATNGQERLHLTWERR